MTVTTRRGGMAATLLRLGHRTGLGTGGGSAVHRLGLAVAAAAVTLTGALVVCVDAVYTARSERLAARTPVLAGPERADDAFARWSERADSVGERRYSIIYVMPTRPDAPPPPGLRRWPQPGESFLSPALLAADPAMRARLGAFAGTIGQEGLSDSGELLAYQRPVTDTGFDALVDSRSYVLTWGTDPSAYRSPPLGLFPHFTDSHAYDRPARDLYALLAVVVGLPVAALVVVCVRFGAERRDRRLAMLHVLGAPRRARVAVLAGEAFVPVAAGVTLASGLALVLTVTGVTLPVAGYRAPAADLAPARPAILACWLLAVGLVLAAAVLGQLRLRRARGNRPVRVRERAHRWAPYVFGFFLAVALGGAIHRGGAGVATYLLGLLGALAALPLVAGRIAAALGAIVARLGGWRGWPAALVAGRWLAGRPNVLARLSAALVIGLCLATLAQISFTQLDTALAQDREVSQRIGHAVVEVRARWGEPELRRFAEEIGADRVVYVLQVEDGGRKLVGTCHGLAEIGELTGCPDRTVPMAQAYTSLSPSGVVVSTRARVASPPLSVVVAAPPERVDRLDGLLVLNPDGAAGVEEVKRAAYATLAMPAVTVPGELALTGTAGWAGLADWLLEFGIWGLVVLFGTGTLATASVFLATARELGPLTGPGAGRSLFTGVALWNLTMPLTAAVLVSALVAAGLGRMLIMLSRDGRLDVGFLTAATLVGAAAALLVGLLCGHGAARRARTWRPHGD